MARVRQRNTKPEMVVRRVLFGLGYRYRLHRKDLPGSPDIVLPGRRKAILVHGCFWHGHVGCRRASIPKSNIEFWTAKITRNKDRDANVIADLSELGWQTLVIWECQVGDDRLLADTLNDFLQSNL